MLILNDIFLEVFNASNNILAPKFALTFCEVLRVLLYRTVFVQAEVPSKKTHHSSKESQKIRLVQIFPTIMKEKVHDVRFAITEYKCSSYTQNQNF